VDAVSSSRDRLGLLLPLPALLAVGPASARAQEPEVAPTRQDEAEHDSPATPQGLDDTALPPEVEPDVRAAFERGEQAFAEGEYREAASAFERAAELAADLVVLRLDAVIALRHGVFAATDSDQAADLCARLRRDAEVIAEHPRATPEMIERARAEHARAQHRCTELEERSVTVTEAPHGPCLVPPLDHEPGCAHGRDDVAMLGMPLLLLGLRSRGRREALERMADRLPPDVMAKLRREPDEE
jgi:hypothetical protein